MWCCGSDQVQSVLGLELLECLYWRRGALLYMYCHTLHQRKQWIKKNKATFLKVLSPTSHSTVPVLVAMIWVSVAMLRVFTVSSRRCALSYENVASEELSQAERWCGFSWLCNRQFSGRRYILANVLSVLNWKTNGWFLWHFWVLFGIWELKTADMQVIVNSDCVSVCDTSGIVSLQGWIFKAWFITSLNSSASGLSVSSNI